MLEPYPETATLCAALGIDALGLIGSGSLIIAARPENTEHLLERLSSAGVDAVLVGTAQVPGSVRAQAQAQAQAQKPAAGESPEPLQDHSVSVCARRGETEVPFPHFHGDELARLYREIAPDA
jgi:hypothetical protein